MKLEKIGIREVVLWFSTCQRDWPAYAASKIGRMC
jgi:hypothetical protein